MLTVGIVNDLATARYALRSVVNQTPGFRTVWEAPDGRIAVERHRAQPADIILLDLLMPGLDGVQATPLLMAVHACAILIVTATVSGNRQMVFSAMSRGALDAVDTPSMHSPAMVDQLRRKLITISRLVRQGSGAAAATHPIAMQPAAPLIAAAVPDAAGRGEADLPAVALARTVPIVALPAAGPAGEIPCCATPGPALCRGVSKLAGDGDGNAGDAGRCRNHAAGRNGVSGRFGRPHDGAVRCRWRLPGRLHRESAGVAASTVDRCAVCKPGRVPGDTANGHSADRHGS